ncbi:MAG: hypothetical protein VXW89_05090, partial [Candidatus Thermoplasmatota archaeon]|nr:hypothetical protein [Candidatus Thermoplasmatota archaeon]
MEIEGDFLRQVVAIILLIAPCLWMSDRFLNRLDPARTDAQRLLIVPGISLFLLLGIIGWSVLLFGELRILSIFVVWGFMEFSSRKFSTINYNNTVHTSPWEKLETQIERTERQKKSSDLKKNESNDNLTQWKFSTDDLWIIIASGAGIIGLLSPHFLFTEPLGIDWIGFATLADTLASTGTTDLPPPTVGHWT